MYTDKNLHYDISNLQTDQVTKWFTVHNLISLWRRTAENIGNNHTESPDSILLWIRLMFLFTCCHYFAASTLSKCHTFFGFETMFSILTFEVIICLSLLASHYSNCCSCKCMHHTSTGAHHQTVPVRFETLQSGCISICMWYICGMSELTEGLLVTWNVFVIPRTCNEHEFQRFFFFQFYSITSQCDIYCESIYPIRGCCYLLCFFILKNKYLNN